MSLVQNITERKNDEKKLLESQERLRRAQAIAHLGSWELNFETDTIKWSHEIFRICGLELGYDLTWEEWVSFVHSADRESVTSQMERSRKEMNDVAMEYKIVRKDGEIRFIFSEARFEFDKEGNPLRKVGIVHDITERKKAEHELRISEMRFHEAQVAARISNWEIDYTTNNHYWSDEFCRIFKINKAKVQPSMELFLSLINPGDKDFVSDSMQEAFKTFTDSSLNFRFVRKDKVLRYAFTKWKFVYDKNGQPIRIFGILQDVSQFKKAEEALQRSESRLNEAQSVAHISNFEMDIRKNIHTWSDEYYRIFGFNKGDVEPSLELFLSFIHPDDVEAFYENLQQSLRTNRGSSANFRFIRKDGAIRHAYSKFHVEFDKSGNATRLFGILQDVTERVEAEEAIIVLQHRMLKQKLEQQKKMTRAMMIAQETERNHLGKELHDNINQILAGAKLYLGMVEDSTPTDKKTIKYAIELIDSCIREIRTLSHRLVSPPKNIELDQNVKDLLDDIQRTTKIKVGFNYSVGSRILTDDLKLNIFRIIQESTNNILNYASAKNISVSISEKDEILDIIVADDGVGFDVAGKRKGIGISNIIHRAESYSGTAEIKSKPGEGSIFAIKIPIIYIP